MARCSSSGEQVLKRLGIAAFGAEVAATKLSRLNFREPTPFFP